MKNIIDTTLPLMTALIDKPGLNVSAEQLDESAKDLMGLMAESSNRVLKVLAQDDPKFLQVINRILARLVAHVWVTSNNSEGLPERLAQVFVAVLDNIDVDHESAFADENTTSGLDTALWMSKCLPPILELKERSPEKKGRGRLLLGIKSYDENLAFIQAKLTEIIERVAGKMMVKDPEAEKCICQVVFELYGRILETQYAVLVREVEQLTTGDMQKAFQDKIKQYPEGILIEKSLFHLDAILPICFPGSKKE